MRMEIITGVERRRRWRLEEKLRIVAEVEQPGVCFAEVARRHEVSRGLLWSWRRQMRRGTLVAEPMPMFMPVRIVADPLPPARALIASPVMPSGEPAAVVEASRIEIALPDGTCIRVGEDIGLVALRRVMAAVRR
jgi:transposase